MPISKETAVEYLDKTIEHLLKADGFLVAYCNGYDYGPESACQSIRLRGVVRWAHAESERLKGQLPPDGGEDGPVP